MYHLTFKISTFQSPYIKVSFNHPRATGNPPHSKILDLPDQHTQFQINTKYSVNPFTAQILIKSFLHGSLAMASHWEFFFILNSFFSHLKFQGFLRDDSLIDEFDVLKPQF